jgi:hypothetical protein
MGAALAQTSLPTEPGEGPRCITLNTILKGEVLSGHEVRFELRDGTILLALLDRDCPQLKFHNRFAYQAVAGRLCAGEGRIVARSGETCMIGSFAIARAPDNPSSDAQ